MNDAVLAQQAPAPIQFRAGTVLVRSFMVMVRHIVPFWALGLVLTSPTYAYLIFVSDKKPFNPAAISPDTLLDAIGSGLVKTVVSFLLVALLMAMVSYATVHEVQGRSVGVGETVSRALGRLLPLIGVSIVAQLAFIAGLMLLVIPGLILIAMWWVVTPVVVMERAGVFAALGRSRRLTKGRRWRILGLFLLLAIGQVAVTIALNMFFELGWRGGPMSDSGLVASWIVSSLYTTFMCVLGAVSYYYLRVEKEGLGIDDTAAVFD